MLEGAVNQATFGGTGVTAARGYRASGVSAGIKKNGKKDLALVVSDVPASVAGVFTLNRVKAAPLLVTMPRVKGGTAQAIIVNSGNANACNGEHGLADARAMGMSCAAALGVPEEMVLVGSTGVIGQPLPVDRVSSALPRAVAELRTEGGRDAAEAIMTTDTVRKEFAVKVNLGDHEATIGGMAKGSGMIHPNMATMLAFITTDAAIAPPVLESALRNACNASFNMVTVDGDTSTNDMLLALANGMAGNTSVTPGTSDYAAFEQGLTEVCQSLAKSVARDGEGATTLIEVRVTGAQTVEDARLAARAICSSNLTKAAVFGRDANWGRIICAAGYSGASFDPAQFDVFLGDLQVAGGGAAVAFDEDAARTILGGDPVVITVDFKQGPGSATAWGCDLTYDYVKINASYRS